MAWYKPGGGSKEEFTLNFPDGKIFVNNYARPHYMDASKQDQSVYIDSTGVSFFIDPAKISFSYANMIVNGNGSQLYYSSVWKIKKSDGSISGSNNGSGGSNAYFFNINDPDYVYVFYISTVTSGNYNFRLYG